MYFYIKIRGLTWILVLSRVSSNNASRKHKPSKAKAKTHEARKDLTDIRVIQRRMAYVIGLPLSLADEEVRTIILILLSPLFLSVDIIVVFASFTEQSLVVFCSSYTERNFLVSMVRLLKFPCLGRQAGLFNSLLMTVLVCKSKSHNYERLLKMSISRNVF